MAVEGTKSAYATSIENYSKRLPKPKRTGDVAKDSDALIAHASLQKIICILGMSLEEGQGEAEQSTIMLTLSKLEVKQEKSAPAQVDSWPASVTTVGKIKDDWWAAWLTTTYPVVSKAMVQKVCARDPEALGRVVMYTLQLPRGTTLPKECLDKQVGARVMEARATLVGERMNLGWIGRAVTAQGDLDWSKGGSYGFEFGEDGRACKITHCGGATEDLAAHIYISKQFELYENWSDFGAYVSYSDGKQAVKYKCSDLFGPNAGPNAWAVKKNKCPDLQKLAETKLQEVATERTKARKGEVVEDKKTLAGGAMSRKRQAAAKAREARIKSNNERKTKRRVKFV